MHVRVDNAELEALQSFPAEDAFQYRGRWRERFVTTLVDMQARSSFIDNLATQLRLVAQRRQLSDDEHLELMVAAIQSIPYVAPESGVRTPAEVVFDGQGICTEKSVTLAALMLHEDYDTVMWSFKSQRHVAIGVATNGTSFRDTGYAFIETTRMAYIGQVDRVYRSSGPTHEPPEQISLGGTRRYEAGHEVTYILRVLDDATRRSRRSSAYLSYAQTARSHRDDFASQATERADAARLVEFITRNANDRPMVYEALYVRSPLS